MKIKHKLLLDYTHTTVDGKIITLKSGSIIIDYTHPDGSISLDKKVIDSNPNYFEPFDWKNELYLYIKKN